MNALKRALQGGCPRQPYHYRGGVWGGGRGPLYAGSGVDFELWVGGRWRGVYRGVFEGVAVHRWVGGGVWGGGRVPLYAGSGVDFELWVGCEAGEVIEGT